MNERGLVVELMWLAGTRYPDPDARAGLVQRSVRGTSFLRDTPDAEIEESARWPERSVCEVPGVR